MSNTQTELLNEPADSYQPLAARMRPQTLEQYQGQSHLIAQYKPLYQSIQSGRLHSMLLWGPAGSGKTSLAYLLSEHSSARFIKISAVTSGVKEIKQQIDTAITQRQQFSTATVLFVDEVHRFNKAQQDVFLPFIENGSIIFVGATTENPSFELNKALLSRCQIYRLKALTDSDIKILIQRSIVQLKHDSGAKFSISEQQIARIAALSNGDARRALNLLENIALILEQSKLEHLDDELLDQVLADQGVVFDKRGDVFYEQISALHKAVRGSDPQASLYWLARMLTGGCDPLYIARRVLRMASEDVGNADPRALQLALNAWDVQQRLGSPEGELAIAQAVVYIACAAKSNAVYSAFKEAMLDAAKLPAYDVPLHLRNAPTTLMKTQGYGQAYRYAHDEEYGFAAGQSYLPQQISERQYYHPTQRGLEKKIAEKLDFLAELNRNSML